MPEPPGELAGILAGCIEAVESGRQTVEECLAQHPAQTEELRPLLTLAASLQEIRSAGPRPAFRNQARQRLIARLPARESVTFWSALRLQRQSFRSLFASRRLSMSWMILIALAASLLAGGGVAVAADGAAPGDLLYPVDLLIERVRADLASDPESTLELQLAAAEERSLEAQELAGRGQTERVQEALSRYEESISDLAKTLQSAGAKNQGGLVRLIDDSLPRQNALLAGVRVQAQEREADEPEEPPTNRCDQIEEHPMAQTLAERYATTPEEVMGWFCQGFGFGEISLAYRSSDQLDLPVDDLFALRQTGLGWGQILQEYGLIGRPDDVPAGPPEGAGPSEGVPPGPPDGAGPPEGVPPRPPEGAGPPEGVPPGPPHEHSPGPPEDAGPPDDVPPGPPEEVGPPEGVPRGPQGNGRP